VNVFPENLTGEKRKPGTRSSGTHRLSGNHTRVFLRDLLFSGFHLFREFSSFRGLGLGGPVSGSTGEKATKLPFGDLQFSGRLNVLKTNSEGVLRVTVFEARIVIILQIHRAVTWEEDHFSSPKRPSFCAGRLRSVVTAA